jgi:hypothetical protein
MGGAWAFYGDQKSDSSSTAGQLNSTTLGIDFYVALRMQVNEWVSAQIGPVLGIGNMRFSRQIGGTDQVGHGEYHEAGLNLEVSLQHPKRQSSFGMGLRYFGSYGEADIDNSGVRQQYEVRQHGFAPYVKMGILF